MDCFGLPLAIAMLGEIVTPSISAVLSMNAMILWTLVSIAVEFAQQTGHLTVKSFLKDAYDRFKLILSHYLHLLRRFVELHRDKDSICHR